MIGPVADAVALTESVQVPLFVTVKLIHFPFVSGGAVSGLPFGVTERANWVVPSGSDVPLGRVGHICTRGGVARSDVAPNALAQKVMKSIERGRRATGHVTTQSSREAVATPRACLVPSSASQPSEHAIAARDTS